MNTPTSLRVLLVDDDDLVRDMYRRLLSRQFDLSVASGAEEAIDLLSRNGPFAVVISDFRMPRINGMELLRQVRKMWPETSRILVSGLLDVPGMDDDEALATVLGKPCSYPEMVEVLKKEIGAYQARVSQEQRA